jgi:hypothetical protein
LNGLEEALPVMPDRGPGIKRLSSEKPYISSASSGRTSPASVAFRRRLSRRDPANVDRHLNRYLVARDSADADGKRWRKF